MTDTPSETPLHQADALFIGNTDHGGPFLLAPVTQNNPFGGSLVLPLQGMDGGAMGVAVQQDRDTGRGHDIGNGFRSHIHDIFRLVAIHLPALGAPEFSNQQPFGQGFGQHRLLPERRTALLTECHELVILGA